MTLKTSRMALIAIALLLPGLAVAAPLEHRGYGEIVAGAPDEAWRTIAADDLVLITLETGTVAVELNRHLAQDHVARMKALVREGFYDGLSFYRVIDGFVAQGGVLSEDRVPQTVDADPIEAEFEEPLPEGAVFTPIGIADGFAPEAGFVDGFPAGRDPENGTVWLAHCMGAFAYGRENEPNTASTEFYITFRPHRYLDRNMSVFGQVIDGMAHLQKLNRVVPDADGNTSGEGTPGKILSMTMAGDVSPEERPTYQIFDTASPLWTEIIASRKNRPEAFFHFRHDHTDICAIPQTVRKVAPEE